MVASIKLNEKVRRLENLRCFQTELDLRKQQLQKSIECRTREEFSRCCPDADEALITRLLDAGFTWESLPALLVAPLAEVAWASGEVTAKEGQKALLSLFDSQVVGNGPAVEQFRNWLKKRPPVELMDLWEDYLTCCRHRTDPSIHRDQGRLLQEQARAIALASGGILGLGAIADAEQAIIDRIERVYSATS